MRIALAADHAGYVLKDELARWLRDQGHEVDGPRHKRPGQRRLSRIRGEAGSRRRLGRGGRGIVVCGSGIGISIAVNRDPRCRCARVDDPLSAGLAREHNDANVLALGARLVGPGHGQGLRPGLPRHRIRRRPPPAPRRPALSTPSGKRLMASAANLNDVQPDGFFTRRLADADPAVAEGIAGRA